MLTGQDIFGLGGASREVRLLIRKGLVRRRHSYFELPVCTRVVIGWGYDRARMVRGHEGVRYI
jgi:hypothetical protein